MFKISSLFPKIKGWTGRREKITPERKQQYQQLNFGLKIRNNAFFGFFKFLGSFGGYLKNKFGVLASAATNSPFLTFKFLELSKDFLVRKLLWSRGRLGRPIANLVILFSAFLVFLTGGVFSGTPFVNSAPPTPDYLSSQDDFIPEVTVATTALPEGRRLEAVVHEVRSGETLTSIGQLYKVSVDALRYVNNLTDEDFLKIGQKITVPPVQGVIYKVKSGDTCDSIGKKFEVAPQAILDFNYLDSCTNLAVDKEIVVPDAKVPAPVIPVSPIFTPPPGGFVQAPVGSGWCIWPTSTRIISQYFSYYHNGLDIATPWSIVPPIYACGEGVVTRSGWDPYGLGLHVVIDHGNGFTTVYGHMRKLNVSVGQEVNKGQVIGAMGSTGRSTGPHLHFTVRYKGVPQNPLKYIK